MATGDTAAPLALSSSSPPLLDGSPSNLSSPLSDVEDKDQDPDDMDLDIQNQSLDHSDTPNRPDDDDEDNDDDSRSVSRSVSDEESTLSDLDVNDSEAETERLYDTPLKAHGAHDVTNESSARDKRQFSDRRDRIFERSPSKLQQQIQADFEAENDRSDNESLPDDEDEADGASLSSSEADHRQPDALQGLAEPPAQNILVAPAEDGPAVHGNAKSTSIEPRKRKRSSDQSDAEQPLRKRTASVGTHEQEDPSGDGMIGDDEAASSNTRTGDQSEEEGVGLIEKGGEGAADSVEEAEPESRKPKKGAAEERKTKSPEEGGVDDEELSEQARHSAEVPTVEEDAGRIAEDEPAEVDAEEEAEATHKNEEELERKKAAWEQLTAIERHFATFRDRLYQERLEQLNQEEAMLTGDNPTHPEYLAMMQCIDARRDERLRVIELEYRLRMDVLKRRATAERAQIMSQFYQGIRESREKVLEDLGRQWYEIQHERRRYANSIPDYSLRYPSTRAQNIRNAVAYNKEVSILSGIAKYRGFPAAPEIRGADAAEIDDDFDAINRARQASHQAATVVPQPFQEYGGLSIGRSLGPAGEQFLEQTPWANPNHPSHQVQRQNSLQESPSAAGPSTASGNRRHSHQPASYNTALVNGESTMQKSKSSGGQEPNRQSKMAQGAAMKREPIAQSS